MYIYKHNDAVPWDKCVATVGFFDGVHGGHRFLLNEVIEEARRQQSISVVVTFNEHPRKILKSDYQPRLLTTLEEKLELLRMFLLNIYGSINAENKVLVSFNVANDKREMVDKYLSENNLFADEPTMSVGKTYTVYSIQVETNEAKTPLAMIRYQLAKLGATNIDTLPIQSSIPSIDTIKI